MMNKTMEMRKDTGTDAAIRMEGVSKRYRLGQIGYGTLQADLQSWWAKVRGKPDPNQRVGKKARLMGDTFLALNDISLEVPKGQTLGILGGNGAGKSTLLKLLAQVTAPTAGTIDLNGTVSAILEVGTGFHADMTGRENVYLNGAILGMSRAETDERFESIVRFSGVEEFIDTPVKRYSSGMRVKLAFAVAVHLTGEILIMDEVLAVSDAAFRKRCIEKLKEAADEGRTVLYVSHNMDSVRELCERCIYLAHGEIAYDGEPETAIRLYKEGKC